MADIGHRKFLVLILGDARQSTPTVSRTSSPEWNVSFDMPITGVQSLLLEGICWNRHHFGKDYLGEFEIALEDIFANGLVTQEVLYFIANKLLIVC